MTNEEIAKALAEIDSRCKSNTHRLDKQEQRQDNLDKLVTAVAGMQKDLEHTQGDVQEIKGDVKAMMISIHPPRVGRDETVCHGCTTMGEEPASKTGRRSGRPGDSRKDGHFMDGLRTRLRPGSQ